MPALKAEMRKLFTVRTTYVLSGILLLIMTGVAFWFGGYNASDSLLADPTLLSNGLLAATGQVAVVGALVAILLMTHEYRYNTILYSLTANSRSQVLVAKFLAVSAFAIGFIVLASLLAIGAAMLGVQLQGATLAPQEFSAFDLTWRIIFYGWAYAVFGLIVAVLIRNQVAALVTMLFLLGVVESLLAFILKDNAAYLPLTALGQVVQPDIAAFFGSGVSASKAALISAAYVVGGGLIAGLSFLKRDAN